MKRWSFLFAAALAFAALPDAAHAQTRTDAGWWEWAARAERPTGSVRPAERAERRAPQDRRTDRRSTRDDDRRRGDRRDDRYEVRVRENAPPFCRNGRGHPTKGMQWCYDKGYVNRRYEPRDRRDDRWERRSVEDIIFGTPRDRTRRTRTVSGRELGDILGRRALGELSAVSTGALAGRWIYPDGSARVLQLRDRRGPLAEMTDFDGDGRVDVVLVNRLR